MIALNKQLANAAAEGRVADIKDLLERGASAGATDERGNPAIVKAAVNNHYECCDLLISKGVGVDEAYTASLWSALHFASCENNAVMAEYFISKSANINIQNRDKRTPLHTAVTFEGAYEVVKCLVGHGARMDIEDKYGETALDIAAICGHLDCFRYMVEHGADISDMKTSVKTALQLARDNEHQEIVDYIESYFERQHLNGAINCQDNYLLFNF